MLCGCFLDWESHEVAGAWSDVQAESHRHQVLGGWLVPFTGGMSGLISLKMILNPLSSVIEWYGCWKFWVGYGVDRPSGQLAWDILLGWLFEVYSSIWFFWVFWVGCLKGGLGCLSLVQSGPNNCISWFGLGCCVGCLAIWLFSDMYKGWVYLSWKGSGGANLKGMGCSNWVLKRDLNWVAAGLDLHKAMEMVLCWLAGDVHGWPYKMSRNGVLVLFSLRCWAFSGAVIRFFECLYWLGVAAAKQLRFCLTNCSYGLAPCGSYMDWVWPLDNYLWFKLGSCLPLTELCSLCLTGCVPSRGFCGSCLAVSGPNILKMVFKCMDPSNNYIPHVEKPPDPKVVPPLELVAANTSITSLAVKSKIKKKRDGTGKVKGGKKQPEFVDSLVNEAPNHVNGVEKCRNVEGQRLEALGCCDEEDDADDRSEEEIEHQLGTRSDEELAAEGAELEKRKGQGGVKGSQLGEDNEGFVVKVHRRKGYVVNKSKRNQHLGRSRSLGSLDQKHQRNTRQGINSNTSSDPVIQRKMGEMHKNFTGDKGVKRNGHKFPNPSQPSAPGGGTNLKPVFSLSRPLDAHKT
ncbi:hypothetical protein E3N88_34249 [Mikania micrantha]|uniref:Uncharacterized protein n=1 Tax=Mikania micrantha TaxID=192012 RepID=A0A5N6LXK3_9ASTR|nr:hypothetical protein E3N88_34249 [Mikania micrantha]